MYMIHSVFKLELCVLCSSNVIHVFKSRRMRWQVPVVCVWFRREKCCKVLRENVKESVMLSLRAYEICVYFQHFWSDLDEIL